MLSHCYLGVINYWFTLFIIVIIIPPLVLTALLVSFFTIRQILAIRDFANRRFFAIRDSNNPAARRISPARARQPSPRSHAEPEPSRTGFGTVERLLSACECRLAGLIEPRIQSCTRPSRRLPAMLLFCFLQTTLTA